MTDEEEVLHRDLTFVRDYPDEAADEELPGLVKRGFVSIILTEAGKEELAELDKKHEADFQDWVRRQP